MIDGPNDFELDDLLEESIYEEVEHYYGDDLSDLAQSADWN